MKKLKWRYEKKQKWHSAYRGDMTCFIIAKSNRQGKRWDLRSPLPDTGILRFNKISSAKKVAQLMHNG